MNVRPFPRASRIGFGCASLGSRIPERRGLDSLALAFDAGVNWFDVAPSYGDGAAETIFAAFARTRRDRIHICTKCGIAPAAPSVIARALKPLAQRAISAAPALRGLAGRGRPAAKPVPLTPDSIRESLEASLRRLKTDYVDVYAFHDPDPDALRRDDVRRALDDVVATGKARAAGIAGSVEAAVAGLRAGLAVTHIQVPDPPFAGFPELLVASMPQNANFFLATHSIYGSAGPLATLLARTRSRAALSTLLAAQGYSMPLEEACRAVLLDCALAANADGVVLLSMFSPAHVTSNMARVKQGTPSEAVSLFRQLAAPVSNAGRSVVGASRG